MRSLLEALLEVLETGKRGALATVVQVSGSVPQQPGARLLLRPDGTCVGTVGGGAIEQAVIVALQEARNTGRASLLVRKLGRDLGMCCGGTMEVFVEPIEAVPRLHLCGAGHVAHATAQLAQSVGFAVTVVDDREELMDPGRFRACRLELRDPAEWMRHQTLGANDWVLIMTHDHRLDEAILESLLEKSPRYIGMIGSKRKVLTVRERLRTKTGAELANQRLYAPVGLDLGAVGPEELAVSIVAELIALRRGSRAVHSRDASLGRGPARIVDDPSPPTELGQHGGGGRSEHPVPERDST